MLSGGGGPALKNKSTVIGPVWKAKGTKIVGKDEDITWTTGSLRWNPISKVKGKEETQRCIQAYGRGGSREKKYKGKSGSERKEINRKKKTDQVRAGGGKKMENEK